MKEISIELNEKTTLNSFKSKKEVDRKEISFNIYYYIFIFFIIVIFFLIFIICYILYLLNLKLNTNNNIDQSYLYLNNNSGILDPYIKAQNDFCKNPNKYFKQNYEDNIFLSDVKVNGLKYKMYLFKSQNFILNEFKLFGSFEIKLGNNIIDALRFYSSKNNIKNNKEIYLLDIGGNIGWYPSLLGRYGYRILSFEPFEKNNYVSKKNYCLLNKDSNVVIITKGLGVEEKKCSYFNQLNNAGNGMVICDKDKLNNTFLGKLFIKESEVEITTLNRFIPFLSDKKIALMKIDVEGHELHVLEGGNYLITNYHVPFVVLEFSPSYLKEAGSDPKNLAQFFVDNGYKISIIGFLNKTYITVDELLSKAGFQINCYFIHNSTGL